MTALETIKHLKTILPAEQFIVTGSKSLFYLGLLTNQVVNDLDIILVKPKDEALATAERLMNDSPSTTKPNVSGYSSKLGLKYIFELNDMKIDVFVMESSIPTLLAEQGAFEIATAEWIFQAKRTAHRDKDWIQLYRIAQSICSEESFLKALDIKSNVCGSAINITTVVTGKRP